MANFVPLLFVDHIDLAGTLRRHEGLYDHGTPRILPVHVPRKGTEEEDDQRRRGAGELVVQPRRGQ